MHATHHVAVSGRRRAAVAAEGTHTATSARRKKAAQIRMAVGGAALLAKSQRRPTVARRPRAHLQTAGRRSFFSSFFFLSVFLFGCCWSLAAGVVAGRHETPETKEKGSLGGKAKGCRCCRGCRARGFKRASTESRLAAPANEVVSRRCVTPPPMGASIFLCFLLRISFFFFFAVWPLWAAVCVRRQVSRGQVGRTWRRRRRRAAWS